MNRRHVAIIVLSCFLTILIGIANAQEGSEPGVEATAESTAPVIIEEATQEPTLEATTEPVVEVTAEATAEPASPTPMETPVEPPRTSPPTDQVNDDFQDTNTTGWILTDGWQLVTDTLGNVFLSASAPGEIAAVDGLSWAHLLLSARFHIRPGDTAAVSVRAGSYVIVLDAAGQASLYGRGVLVAQGTPAASIIDAEGTWRTLNLQLLGDLVTVGVDGKVQFSYSDPALLAEGGVYFSTGVGNTGAVGLDDVTIIRLDAPVPPPPPTETPVPPTPVPALETPAQPAAQPAAITQIDGLPLDWNGFGRKPSRSNLTSSLDSLGQTWAISQSQALADASLMGLEMSDDRVLVTIIMNDLPQADAAVNALPGLGAEVTSRYEYWIDASVPVSALLQVAALPGVNEVRPRIAVYPLQEPINNPPVPENLLQEAGSDSRVLPAGSILTQGVAASKANTWHNAGWYGQGVNIAILDSFQGYTTAQALGELPATIFTYGTLDLGDPHGTAVAEIIHDMAPEATLTLASPSSAVEMANMIVALASQGNDIISSSMGFYNAEAGDGIGPVSSAITVAYVNYGTLYVQAAGNQAQYNWQGVFRDGDRDGYMNFTSSSSSEINMLNKGGLVPAGWPILLQLRWNDWNDNRNGNASRQDYDLFVVYRTGSGWSVVASSVGNQANASLTPTEQITYIAPVTGYYGVAVLNYNASGTHVIDLMGHNAPPFQYNIPAMSLIDAATNTYSFSVAALNRNSPYALEPYSSRGRTMGIGGTLTGGIQQPRISGFANVNTWAYGPNGFNGTSSAAPHVAGAAALVWSAYSNYGPGDVRNFLEKRAIDMGASGYDTTYGRGRLNLGTPPKYPAPGLVFPANGAYTNDNTPLFSWNPSSFGGTAPTAYFIQIDNNANFATPERSGIVGDLSGVLTEALPDGLYYWRVRALNGIVGGNWSSARTFRIDTVPPNMPELVAPTDGRVMTTRRPALSWKAAAGASRYEVLVDDNPGFSSPEVNRSTTALSLTVPTALAPGTYYWYVIAYDRAGNFQASFARNFTITP